MRIDRFSVRDFRKLVGDIEISGLEPGLTVISGDNEEGKSTLLKALQAAFFDRHGLTGKAIEEILPFGTRGLRPRIEVEFEQDGMQYRLEKAFAQGAMALLEGGGGHWRGEAAEDRLRELLGFSQPGRGPAKEEHRGLAGLLWVEQGRAFAPLEMNRDSQAVLREAIEGEVGQVLGGERGRRLLDTVERRTGEFFTPTGRDRPTLSAPRKRVEELEQEHGEKEHALRDYDDKVNRLGALQERLARYEYDGSLASAKAAADRADEAVRRLKDVEAEAKTARARMDEAQAVADAAQGEKDRRAKLAAEAAAIGEQELKAAEALTALEPESVQADRDLAKAEQRFDDASRRRESAEAAWQSARRARERAELTAELRELDERLNQAESLIEEVDRERRTLASNPVDENVLDELRETNSELLSLRAALEATAATLAFAPAGDRVVSVDGQPVDTSRPVRVSESKAFELQGFGGVEVTPGGEDIARLRANLSDTESRMRRELLRLGLNDLAAAEASLRARQALASRLEGFQGRLAGVVPEGVEGLQDSIRRKREFLAAVGQDVDSPDVEPARLAEKEADIRRNEANRAAEDAMQGRETARDRRDRVRAQRIEAEVNHRQQAGRSAGLAAELERARQEATDDELAARLRKTGAAVAQRGAEHEAARDQHEALDPEGVKFEQQRAREAYARLRATIDDDRQAGRELAVELRTLGQRGLAEEHERIEGELEIARDDLTRIEADAKAWKLLLETLREAEREAKETFLGPVRERLQPYLRMLFPDTVLQLDEGDLEIVSILRKGVEEPFASLSIGAREQVAVLTRLALADLLREKGKPVALILDDPLVNSDDKRFRRMQLALRKAAASLQIIVLTCHETRYEPLGAKMIRLADCRTGSTG